MFLVLHLILVAKQQTRVLGGLCCHPIFNSPLCAKITVSFKWTIAALLSMVAQVFLWNQFIISSFVLCKGCSHRCRLGSWWCLSHIPYRVPFAVGKRMNEWDKLFWSPYAYGKLYQKFSCLGGTFLPIFASPFKQIWQWHPTWFCLIFFFLFNALWLQA